MVMVWILLLFFLAVTGGQLDDPSDFFTGSKPRPRLTIVSPDNGEVLEDNAVQIRIRLQGYSLNWQLHDSQLCVGLSSAQTYSEECFEQSQELAFQATGLGTSTQYTLRVVLFERGAAIAMSVRSFRVGGVSGVLKGPDESAVVSISTALHVAVQHQTSGEHKEAEHIYRQILMESPYQPDALHLLGLIFYQEGNPASAVPYIERALLSNRTYAGFHNSLGECYRALDRLSDAKKQFELALDLSPTYISARFNLGLTYQQAQHWTQAVEQFRFLRWGLLGEDEGEMATGGRQKESRDTLVQSAAHVLLDSRVRECDLLGVVDYGTRQAEALTCWEEGHAMFPSDGVICNELGTLYSQAGRKEDALRMFQLAVGIAQANTWALADAAAQRRKEAAEAGRAVSEAEAYHEQQTQHAQDQELSFGVSASLNAAHVLEVLGYADESRNTFSSTARKVVTIRAIIPSTKTDHLLASLYNP
jgi:tetratricopeptide (TPR) repeat protein